MPSSLIRPDPMSDRVAVLLAMADCKDDPVALQVCDMWLRMFPLEPVVSFTELSQIKDA